MYIYAFPSGLCQDDGVPEIKSVTTADIPEELVIHAENSVAECEAESISQ